MGTAVIVVLLFQVCVSIPIDDPSTWPGHLESFGSKQKTVDIDVYYEWPSPKDFFEKFVDRSLPALFRGVNKYSKAIHLWNDEYFTEQKSSEDMEVEVELNLKENRTGKKLRMSFSKFIDTYHEEPFLMFSTIPQHLMKDVLMPSPLTCNETSKHLVNAMGFISRGGSKSVVCNEDVETILCPIHGVTDVQLIEYTRNKNYVIDKPEGGYSTVDVDKVDYVKYPNLRKVDQYVQASVREGDCLYIPYRWYKQMNGHANRYGQNIALNLWFAHLHDHAPTACEMSPQDATLDKFKYTDLLEGNDDSNKQNDKRNKGREIEEDGVDEGVDERDSLRHFYSYFKITKRKNMTFEEFYKILKKDEGLTQQDHRKLEFPETFKMLAAQLYERLDLNNDTRITKKEFKKIFKNSTMISRITSYLEYQIARIEDYVEDLVEAKHHGEPLHKFEERMKEKFRTDRKFDEL